MSAMTDRVAIALEQTFKDRVAASAGQPFDTTGVIVPGLEVWQAYARAAVEAMRDPTDAMTNQGIIAWGEYRHVVEVWHEMIDEALK